MAQLWIYSILCFFLVLSDWSLRGPSLLSFPMLTGATDLLHPFMIIVASVCSVCLYMLQGWNIETLELAGVGARMQMQYASMFVCL